MLSSSVWIRGRLIMTLSSDELKTRWVYEQDDGRIAIVIPFDENLTLDEIKAKSVPDGKISYTVTADDIPTDRTFRDAWTYTP